MRGGAVHCSIRSTLMMRHATYGLDDFNYGHHRRIQISVIVMTPDVRPCWRRGADGLAAWRRRQSGGNQARQNALGPKRRSPELNPCRLSRYTARPFLQTAPQPLCNVHLPVLLLLPHTRSSSSPSIIHIALQLCLVAAAKRLVGSIQSSDYTNIQDTVVDRPKIYSYQIPHSQQHLYLQSKWLSVLTPPSRSPTSSPQTPISTDENVAALCQCECSLWVLAEPVLPRSVLH